MNPGRNAGVFYCLFYGEYCGERYFLDKKREFEVSLKPSSLLLAGPTRLELATSGVTGRRSNQLNYDPAISLKINQLKIEHLKNRQSSVYNLQS
jgi:hypothetical protein